MPPNIIISRSLPESPRGKIRLQPILRGAVFGEDDDSIVQPFAVGPDIVSDPIDQIRGLAIALGLGRSRPVPHLFEEGGLFASRVTKERVAASTASSIASSANSSSAYSSSTLSICRGRMPMEA